MGRKGPKSVYGITCSNSIVVRRKWYRKTREEGNREGRRGEKTRRGGRRRDKKGTERGREERKLGEREEDEIRR